MCKINPLLLNTQCLQFLVERTNAYKMGEKEVF